MGIGSPAQTIQPDPAQKSWARLDRACMLGHARAGKLGPNIGPGQARMKKMHNLGHSRIGFAGLSWAQAYIFSFGLF
jgi:hypothetical protein